MNTRIITLTVIGLTLFGLVIFTVPRVNAGWFGFGNSDFVSNFAKKLGIGEDKVKQALGSIQTERQKEMRALYEERLTQLVKDGKITQVQKQAILKKHDELQTKREAERTDLENWAKQNGLDNLYLFGGFGHGIHRGGMMWK